jgi:type II secretory pathway pseudopilin PulG
MRPKIAHAHGVTLVELLAVVAIITLLIGLLLPALSRTLSVSRTMRDGTQIKSIHQSMMAHAGSSKGQRMPTPGLINRVGTVPGSGAEDYSQNRTQRLYSALVAENLFNTDILIGPTEVNPQVRQLADYNYDAYQPASDSYWDPAMQAQVGGMAGSTQVSHTSYAHLVLVGYRKTERWRATGDSSTVHMGTRGVKDGLTQGPDYTNSPTLRLHGSSRMWAGNLCFADNHVEFVETFTPEGVAWECDTAPLTKDNIFAAEFTQGACVPRNSAGQPQVFAGGDTWLGIHPNNVTQYIAIPVYDQPTQP